MVYEDYTFKVSEIIATLQEVAFVLIDGKFTVNICFEFFLEYQNKYFDKKNQQSSILIQSNRYLKRNNNVSDICFVW